MPVATRPIYMDSIAYVKQIFADGIEVKQSSVLLLAEPIALAAHLICAQLLLGNKILSCGNGGSAADAQHFSSKMINRFERERPGIPALALTTDTSALTSIANDSDYAEIFARQVRTLGQPGDVLIAISTSGNSINVNKAIEAAHTNDMLVIALSGRDGGQTAGILKDSDIELRIPSNSTARIQEVHLVILHCLCALIDTELLGE